MPTTDETCETTGIYRGECAAGAGHQREIAITKGTVFPPCTHCARPMT